MCSRSVCSVTGAALGEGVRFDYDRHGSRCRAAPDGGVRRGWEHRAAYVPERGEGRLVVAYDASPEAREGLAGTGVGVAGSLAEVAQRVEVCVLSLPNSDVVEEVVFGEDGLLEGPLEGDAVVDTSSSRPSSTREVARRLAQRGMGCSTPRSAGACCGPRWGTWR